MSLFEWPANSFLTEFNYEFEILRLKAPVLAKPRIEHNKVVVVRLLLFSQKFG